MLKFIFCITSILLFQTREAASQIVLVGNTQLTIPSGASVVSYSLGDSISIASSAGLINNGILDLRDASVLNDSASPITGSGYETSFLNTSDPNINNNIGNLGFVINTTSSIDSINIKRYHHALTINTETSINRVYEIFSNHTDSAFVQITYNDSELNGLLESNLNIAQNPSGNLWNIYTSGLNSTLNVTDVIGIDSLFGTFTLIDSMILNSILKPDLSEFSVYPNPAIKDHTFSINMDHSLLDRESSLMIFSLNGSLISTHNLNQSQEQVFKAPDAPGSYILCVRGKDYFNRSLLVVQ